MKVTNGDGLILGGAMTAAGVGSQIPAVGTAVTGLVNALPASVGAAKAGVTLAAGLSGAIPVVGAAIAVGAGIAMIAGSVKKD